MDWCLPVEDTTNTTPVKAMKNQQNTSRPHGNVERGVDLCREYQRRIVFGERKIFKTFNI
jgi:hypothetical protein